MECMLQVLDELDDLIGCIALRWESLRRTLLNFLMLVLIVEAVWLDDPTWLFTVIVTYGFLIPASLIACTLPPAESTARRLLQDLRI